MIKHYLQLVRIPGIFTAFSNILFGFFLVHETTFDPSILISLLSASGLLFMAGMILNDYFDYKIDKIERPFRPLPSRLISKKIAFLLATLFLIAANVFSFLVGIQPLLVSLTMTVLIIIYDCGIKRINYLGIMIISFIRILNVILGTSTNSFNLEILYFVMPIGVFVTGISILAKNETLHSTKKIQIINLIFIIVTMSYTLILILNRFTYISLAFMSLFIVSILIPYLTNMGNEPKNIQKKITYQLLAIILLDATLTSIVSNVSVTLIIISLYIQAYFLTRKMYFT